MADDAGIPDLEPVGYDGPVGGWGSMKGMAQVGRKAHAEPGALDTLRKQNKHGGTMCTSCAWGKPPNPHVAEFCENGAKATLWDLTGDRCGPDLFLDRSVSELATWSEYDLERLGRLTHPLRYDAATDRYLETSWEEAFAAIGAELRALDPKAVTFYASGKAALEASFLYGLFARALGHNNLPDSSNMCHETTSIGLKQVIGSPVGTCTLEDFDHCDMILHVGQNPGTNSPRMLHPLQEAAKRGCCIVAINPLREKGLLEFASPQSPWQMTVGSPTEISDRYLQVRPGGDIAVLSGIAKHVLHLEDAEGGVLDHDFVAQHTDGLDDWMAWLRDQSWDDLERESGITRAAMEAVGASYARAKAVIGVYGMGITQHVHGADAIGALVNLLLLRGNIGRQGAGCSPVRGHSNVQGQRTVGITEKPDLVPNDRLRDLFGMSPPMEEGWNTNAFVAALLEGRAQGFIGLGGNLARAVPDQDRVAEAWGRMPLTVHVATRLNRTHLMPGRSSWLLPCLVRAEQDLQQGVYQQVTIEDSFSHIHGSIGARQPAGPHLRSEVAIVAGLAMATLPEDAGLPWAGWAADYRRIRAAIEQVYPDDFADFERRIDQPGGFYRGNPARERQWQTESGKAQFTCPESLDATGLGERPGIYRLITLRSNDQFNTTVYGMSDRLRGIEGDRMLVMMSPADMAAEGLRPDQRITLDGAADDGIARSVAGLRVVPYDLPRGSLAGYFPELNPLSPLSRADKASDTPAAKGIPVRLA
ncbi:formate dehydrogenase [Paracoccus aestuarii]|uniref:Formate dehydrogenase n=1 Tax=Paracoccus aestuarii TaxID=453842 RepID=A0A419A1Z0_9RHOB|nr:FdhF/YdeP family oxidoreductase [Paracoccus aestuarii]RJL07005.1 formate dehydrogenase [Paracoccus aestuarii]WCR00522.1 FdhF/YdeP family oxidoreductase [Paracoccus aestuarii]